MYFLSQKMEQHFWPYVSRPRGREGLISLCPTSKVNAVLSNRAVPFIFGRQMKAMAIACTILGISGASIANNYWEVFHDWH